MKIKLWDYENEWDRTEMLLANTFLKEKASQIIYFPNLVMFINKFHFKPTSLPWKLENASYTLKQITNKDAYGFAVYDIRSKRHYDDSIYKGRLPNSKFAEEVLLAIAEDYHIENLENDTIND